MCFSHRALDGSVTLSEHIRRAVSNLREDSKGMFIGSHYTESGLGHQSESGFLNNDVTWKRSCPRVSLRGCERIRKVCYFIGL